MWLHSVGEHVFQRVEKHEKHGSPSCAVMRARKAARGKLARHGRRRPKNPNSSALLISALGMAASAAHGGFSGFRPPTFAGVPRISRRVAPRGSRPPTPLRQLTIMLARIHVVPPCARRVVEWLMVLIRTNVCLVPSWGLLCL